MIDGPSATVVAIAKNEERYIVEWIAHNIAIGFDKIVIYINDSSDGMLETIEKIEKSHPCLRHVLWPSKEGVSPQVSAYNSSVSLVDTDWISFLDIDEFLVPFSYGNLKSFLDKVPEQVSSVHINWRNFGSSGRVEADYGLVTDAFIRAAPQNWGNHFHFKSIARTKFVNDVHIHDIGTTEGLRTLSDFKVFDMQQRGIADRVVYEGIQINHYQSKTFGEFCERMRRGDANFAYSQPRDHTVNRFRELDRNEEEDRRIENVRNNFIEIYTNLRDVLKI